MLLWTLEADGVQAIGTDREKKDMTMKRALLSIFGLAVLFGTLSSAEAQHRHCHYRHHHRVCR